MTQTVLILGPSGKIGTHAARAFSAAGWTVRLFDRKTQDMTKAAQGADVIVNGLNPANYHNWAGILPQITRQVIAAAQASGATVILPGNIYNFGRVNGVIDEGTPQTPISRKGQIRKEIEAMYKASGVQTIVLRAGNFIDPDRNADVASVLHLSKIAKGRITTPGATNVQQAWCYLPDWAQAAVMLAEKRAELARFEDVPFAGHSFSVEEWKATLEQALNRPLKVAPMPWGVMRLTAPFWELARELLEMRYIWDMDHQISGAKLARLLPDFQPTPLRQVMLASVPQDIHPDHAMTGHAKAVLTQ